jgi:hypothetical protein
MATFGLAVNCNHNVPAIEGKEIEQVRPTQRRGEDQTLLREEAEAAWTGSPSNPTERKHRAVKYVFVFRLQERRNFAAARRIFQRSYLLESELASGSADTQAGDYCSSGS